jgi:beta-lactamase class A
MDKLEEELTKMVKELSGKVSIYVKYLQTDEAIKLNEQIQLKAASIIKIPILCEFYHQIRQNKIDIKNWTKISEENRVKGSGVLNLLNQKTEYSVCDLARLMIIISDNSATNEIIDMIGWENVEIYMKKLSLNGITLRHKMMITAGRGENLITAEDIGSLLEKIYRNTIEGSSEMMDILKEQQMREYLPKLLPKNVLIAHKTGVLADSLHDAGIVFAKNPFLFIFLSEEQKNREETGKILSQCAKLCYDYSDRT